jgi:iron complex outermembrane receptor protein
MPSFTELYYSVGGHKADPHLRPEELRAVEGGLRYDARGLALSASVFHHHARNLIDWVLDTRDEEPVWQSVNFTRVNTFGQELKVDLPITRRPKHESSLSVAYCHLHQQKDDVSNLQSRYALEYLRHKVTASLSMPLAKRLSLTVKYRYQDRTGSYTDTNGEVRDYRPYSVVDSRLNWARGSYALYVEGNNLLGTRYVDYGNVPQPGCWLMVGAKITGFAKHALHN